MINDKKIKCRAEWGAVKMGLDFNFCDAYWSCSSFNAFRERLSKYIDKCDDPLVMLINHSDCDGELTPEECAKIAPRLRAVVELWKDQDIDKGRALELAKGMEEAVRRNEPLEFL